MITFLFVGRFYNIYIDRKLLNLIILKYKEIVKILIWKKKYKLI